jgi:cobalt-zinc-cadmium efflux system outer membrane protein
MRRQPSKSPQRRIAMRRIGFTGLVAIGAATLVCFGCQSARQVASQSRAVSRQGPAPPAAVSTNTLEQAQVQLASHLQPQRPPAAPGFVPDVETESISPPVSDQPVESLDEMEFFAVANNPTLQRMRQEASAEWARARYVAKLPDPTVSSMFFLPPMHFEPDRQVAEIQVMQMIPWLARLSAEERRAQLEAMAAENQFHAERLRVLADLRSAWYRLYVVGKQIEIAEAEKGQIQALINTANARVRTGNAQPGDVLMATLEFSNLQEQLLSFRQQQRSTIAELNRLLGRDSSARLTPPKSIDAEMPEWTHDWLLSVAMSSQPELNSARLRTAASRWGIDVARLKRRPDLTFSGGWMVMDAVPGTMAHDAGSDSWTLGVSASLPVWHREYDAMVFEASRQHFAAHASEEEVAVRLDATLRDLWEQARAAQQTIELYEQTILPQARQTYEADQQSLANNTVSFDRVIRDYRTLLNLELGYHRALGQLAVALARIQQTVGVDLTTIQVESTPR